MPHSKGFTRSLTLTFVLHPRICWCHAQVPSSRWAPSSLEALSLEMQLVPSVCCVPTLDVCRIPRASVAPTHQAPQCPPSRGLLVASPSTPRRLGGNSWGGAPRATAQSPVTSLAFVSLHLSLTPGPFLFGLHYRHFIKRGITQP